MKKTLFFALLTAILFIFISCNNKTPKIGGTEVNNIPPDQVKEMLSSFRGFNLLNMFIRGSSDDKPFSERDFETIAEWGFNFVRIPMDYRLWTTAGDWSNINESAIERLDRAIEYGLKYNIHICINFHRAPGYTVASPAETTDLWTESEPQEAFARMWAYFAERYKHVPGDKLSFNLLNEPPMMDESLHAAVMKKAVDAIREKDPNRLIIADGRDYGWQPSYMIRDMGLAQSTRGYFPNIISHYRAEWLEGSNNFGTPGWPIIMIPSYLYAPGKQGVPRSIFSIEHNFNEAYYLDVNVAVVSRDVTVVAKADGNIIYEREIISGPGEGEWSTVVYNQEWSIYQNIFDRDYRINIPGGTKFVTIEVTDGDWMTINDLKFLPVSSGGNGKRFSLTPNNIEWGERIPAVKFDDDGNLVFGSDDAARTWLWNTAFRQWESYIDQGGVIVGEWGAYNKTPHDVVLRWMEENLINFKEHKLGWALWNFSGSFGVVNSGRNDVQYELYNGYRLDRKMLDLLQKYL